MIERIKIRLDFLVEFWDKPPLIDLILDNKIISRSYLLDKNPRVIEQTVDLELNQTHLLQVRRYNKSDDQCVVGADGIRKDQYVILDKLSIDGIDVQNLMWSRSWYEPEYPQTWRLEQESTGIKLEDKIVGETWWSHNGVWNFEFSSPFYKFVINQFA